MDHVSDYDYRLPPQLIAQRPGERGASRMLVVSREKQTFFDDSFSNFHRYIRSGDCLVLNNTRVFPARLRGRKNSPAGAAIEVFLLRPLNPEETEWRALIRPGKRVRPGDEILFGEGVSAAVLQPADSAERIVSFRSARPVREALESLGEIPLPPYIHRTPDAIDRERYQTVFAEKTGSVAAPTAGLHFTPDVLEACRTAGALIARVTLHVGLGTFAPLEVAKIEDIRLHEEHFEIDAPDASAMAQARRMVCVGTTSVRTVETAILRGGLLPMSGETSLFISPGYQFRGAGALLTNFHLPKSSLLMLVCAFANRDLILSAYRHAVASGYRFFSYGDCMLIE